MMRTALVALVAGAVLTVSTGCGIRIMMYEFSDDHAVAEKITSVKVRSDQDSGDVTIRFQEGLTEAKIHRRVEHERDNKPSGVAHRVEGNTLVLDGCGRDCEINYEVLVPSAATTVVGDIGSGDVIIEGLASVEFKTGSGRITTRDIAGDVKVKTGSGGFEGTRIGGAVTADMGSGRIALDAIKGKALLDTGSGDIEGTSLENEVIAKADSGDIALTLSAAKSVRANSGSGSVTVRVPGGPFKITGSSGSGERAIHVPTDPSASLELSLTASSGDVQVFAA
ncbi:DUF4097 family beta strand repeat-containing protein [Lentzea sp. BCCO 10_0798]|uniref:DUF4097 family beta strand repeat-containing protein n=1 Tax=Lentzea kristufekii TaxID=3095430 RepID=A0ABU4TLS2_9PSEU|nr:DUF4097 family beta strand repeat-containing protein [Lentzea sp. BCCO 10_0798]MDX8049237.1 DUF4097 family beta strand repeat-containing protein [Lentzea sp. BCCO 10_0798]